MADLMTSNSTWAAGTTDTASTLQNGVDQKRAEHINGPASAIIALEQVLGPAASLKGIFTDLATRLGQQIPSNGQLLPTGIIWMYGGSIAPPGFLICDGSAVSRSVYADLFAVIGTIYGPGLGDGLTFSLPPSSGRTPVGVGSGVGGGISGSAGTAPSGGAALITRLRGEWFGSDTHQLDVSQLPSHQHAQDGNAVFGFGPGSTLQGAPSTAFIRATSTGFTGGSQPHPNTQPSFVVNFIIKT